LPVFPPWSTGFLLHRCRAFFAECPIVVHFNCPISGRIAGKIIYLIDFSVHHFWARILLMVHDRNANTNTEVDDDA